jgi:transposase, IS5 family
VKASVTEEDEDNKPFTDEEDNYHSGSMKVDATCCDAEVKYPTDLYILNDARDVSERLIDKLCDKCKCSKPRTYRKEARHKYLNVIKRRNKSKKLVHKGIKQQ